MKSIKNKLDIIRRIYIQQARAYNMYSNVNNKLWRAMIKKKKRNHQFRRCYCRQTIGTYKFASIIDDLPYIGLPSVRNSSNFSQFRERPEGVSNLFRFYTIGISFSGFNPEDLVNIFNKTILSENTNKMYKLKIKLSADYSISYQWMQKF